MFGICDTFGTNNNNIRPDPVWKQILHLAEAAPVGMSRETLDRPGSPDSMQAADCNHYNCSLMI